MATSIATGALGPRTAVALSGVLNLVGAFLSLAVAATIASGLVDTKLVTLTVVAAGLAGGIIWNLLTWLFGIPSSSSHALIGGVIGSTLAAAGGHAVKWHGLVAKVVIPAALSLVIQTFAGEAEQRRALATWSAVGGVGATVGSTYVTRAGPYVPVEMTPPPRTESWTLPPHAGPLARTGARHGPSHRRPLAISTAGWWVQEFGGGAASSRST